MTLPRNVTDVGAYVNAPSAYGTFDQCGNVFEWIEDEPGPGSTFRGVRGGSWANAVDECFSSVRAEAGPGLRASALGFRPAGRLP